MVTHADALPGDYGLGRFPAQGSDRRGGIGDALIDIDPFLFGFYALDLAAFYGQDGYRCFLRAPEQCECGDKAEDDSSHDDM